MTALALYRTGRVYFVAPSGLTSEEARVQRVSAFFRDPVAAWVALHARSAGHRVDLSKEKVQ